MSEIPNVIGGDTATANWANLVKERTAMRYASAADREASIPAPIDGSLAWLDDTNDLTVYADGGWQNVAFSGGNVNSLSWGGPLTGILHEDGSATFNNGMRVEQAASFEGGLTFGVGILTSIFHEDGSATFVSDVVTGGKLTVNGANQAELHMNRDSVGVRWRFAIIPSGALDLQSSTDGVSWQTEETWVRA